LLFYILAVQHIDNLFLSIHVWMTDCLPAALCYLLHCGEEAFALHEHTLMRERDTHQSLCLVASKKKRVSCCGFVGFAVT
jgi:hypothetical protein